MCPEVIKKPAYRNWRSGRNTDSETTSPQKGVALLSSLWTPVRGNFVVWGKNWLTHLVPLLTQSHFFIIATPLESLYSLHFKDENLKFIGTIGFFFNVICQSRKYLSWECLALLQVASQPWAAGKELAWTPGFGSHLLGLQVILMKATDGDFPSGSVVKNPPVNAEDMALIPGPGRSHMPWGN